MGNPAIYQVDAFTEEPFKGNPAGVMIIDETVSDGWMQQMAAEMNLSETAFVVPNSGGFHIRYFTPASEVALCGHATLASAHILYELGVVKPSDPIHFKAKGGDLAVRRENGWMAMNFPAYPLEKINVAPEFSSVVGFEPVECYASLYNWIVAVASKEEDIARAAPDFAALKKHGLGHLMITARSESVRSDFVVRCFAPSLGIDEDPVTGSAYCALTPLWATKLRQPELRAMQLSQRGGLVKVRLMGDRVEMKGQAVTVFEGRLRIGLG